MNKVNFAINMQTIKIFIVSSSRPIIAGLTTLVMLIAIQAAVSAQGNTGINFVGVGSYAVTGKYIDMKVDKIVNKRAAKSKTGSLRVSVWATKEAYNGGTINGYVLGRYSMEPLQGGFTRSNVAVSVQYAPPPKGTYVIVMTLDEFDSSHQWVTADFITFKKLQAF